MSDKLVVRWIRNNLAVLVVRDGGRHGIDWGTTQRKAERMAKQMCKGRQGRAELLSVSPKQDLAQRGRFYGMGGTTEYPDARAEETSLRDLEPGDVLASAVARNDLSCPREKISVNDLLLHLAEPRRTGSMAQADNAGSGVLEG